MGFQLAHVSRDLSQGLLQCGELTSKTHHVLFTGKGSDEAEGTNVKGGSLRPSSSLAASRVRSQRGAFLIKFSRGQRQIIYTKASESLEGAA